MRAECVDLGVADLVGGERHCPGERVCGLLRGDQSLPVAVERGNARLVHAGGGELALLMTEAIRAVIRP